MSIDPLPTSSHGNKLGRTGILVLILLVLVAAFFRLWGLPRESLDMDEVFTYRVVNAPGADAIRMIRDDLVHPPVFYYVVRFWTAIGGMSVLGVRFVSLASGIGLVALMWYMGHKFSNLRVAAWLAAALVAVNDVHIYHSQQARSTAFYVLLCGLLLLWTWMLPRFGQSLPFWGIGTLLMVLLVYSHYIGAVYIACVTLAVAIATESWRVRRRIFLAATVSAIGILPWIDLEYPVYLAKKTGLADNLGWMGPPSTFQLASLWASFIGVPDIPAATTLVLLLGGGLIAMGIVFRERTPQTRLILSTLVLTAVVPPILAFAASQKPLNLPIFGERYLLPSMLSWLILVAYGVSQIASRVAFRKAMLVCGAAVLLTLQLAPTLQAMRSAPRRLPFADVARDVEGNVPIYTTVFYAIGEPVNFYLNGRGTVQSLALPDSIDVLPSTFVLLYRPKINVELSQFDVLVNQGWSVLDQKDYYNGKRSAGFVRASRMCRGACK